MQNKIIKRKLIKKLFFGIGALTSKPYSFKGRSWELNSIESLDFFDAYGSKIKIDLRGLDILRILPWVDANLNEDWITDKIRFGYDGLKYQRLDTPLLRVNNLLVPVSWNKAFDVIQKKIYNFNYKPVGVVGKFADLSSIKMFKSLLNMLGSSHIVSNVNGLENVEVDFLNLFLFNSKYSEISDKNIGYCLLIGCDLRKEAPLLNIKLRQIFLKKWKKFGKLYVACLGYSKIDNFPFLNLGNSLLTLIKIVEGRHFFSKRFFKNKNSFIFVGENQFQRYDFKLITNIYKWFINFQNQFKNIIFKFNFIFRSFSELNNLFLGNILSTNSNNYSKSFIKKKKKNICLYLFGNDEIKITKNKSMFIIYQGHHGDRSVNFSDIVLPAASPLEKNGIYLNLEGRFQKMTKVSQVIGQAKIDANIFKGLSKIFNKDLLRSFSLMKKTVKLDDIFFLDEVSFLEKTYSNLKKEQGTMFGWQSTIEDYYLTDSISRSSLILTIASNRLKEKKNINFKKM